MTRAAAVALLLAACGGPRTLVLVPRGAAAPPGAHAVLEVDVASDTETRMRGLGGVADLPDGRGMLFAYPSAEPRRFWMKGCLVGLDVAFVRGDRTIVSVATLPPPERGAEPAAAESGEPVPMVVEAAAGWFARAGIRPGDRVDADRPMRGVEPR
ncbi:MAG: hypothetical protein HMLKMBBP_03057 [Planctomycetes bacterium]|nr:hypothetical protein [Planctomycetota bacterium]